MELILIIGKTYWTFIKGPIYTKAYQKLKSYFYCCIYKKKIERKNWDFSFQELRWQAGSVWFFFFFFSVAFNLQ